eukprot:358427-Pleurochrysis_carterae.AAC.1
MRAQKRKWEKVKRTESQMNSKGSKEGAFMKPERALSGRMVSTSASTEEPPYSPLRRSRRRRHQSRCQRRLWPRPRPHRLPFRCCSCRSRHRQDPCCLRGAMPLHFESACARRTALAPRLAARAATVEHQSEVDPCTCTILFSN